MSRLRRTLIVALLLLCCPAAGAHAQVATRRLATLDALRQFPGYYHLQNVLVRGEFSENGTRVSFRADERQMDVLLAEGQKALDGPVEVRAQLIDVGRLEPGDPRLTRYTGAKDAERWPRPGEELLLVVNGVASADTGTAASVRALSLEPWRFDTQTITLVGQFRGRNLYADLAGAPGRSKYDFVLKGPEGAVWITGLRPRGKGFDLNVDARVDTGRWLRVTGVVKRERALVTIEATKIESTPAPAATALVEEPAVPAAPPQPAEIVFSSPTADETGVAPSASVRIQFSRGLNPATLAGQIRVTYAVVPGVDAPAAPEFKVSYDAPSRAVELKFTPTLAAHRHRPDARRAEGFRRRARHALVRHLLDRQLTWSQAASCRLPTASSTAPP